MLIATPTTLLALLHSVGYGWQQERVAESAQAVSELGRELHGRLAKLSALIANVGTRLNSTVKAYNKAVGSYEARVLPERAAFRRPRRRRASGAEMPELRRSHDRPRDVQLAPDDEQALESVTKPWIARRRCSTMRLRATCGQPTRRLTRLLNQR